MDAEQRKRWLPLLLLGAALLIWAALLALGAVLQLGDERGAANGLKAIVIFSGMCVFLAAWGTALWFRNQRK
jgi:hypothetical protein